MESTKVNITIGSLLHVFSGQNDQQGRPMDQYQRYVDYIPFATIESTGLALTPFYPGGLWIGNAFCTHYDQSYNSRRREIIGHTIVVGDNRTGVCE